MTEIIINVVFYITSEKEKIRINCESIKYCNILDFIKKRFEEKLCGYYLDNCIINGSSTKEEKLSDRMLENEMIIHLVTWKIMKDEIIEYIKENCTTKINISKIVSTPKSGNAPKIIYWHYINFGEYDWDSILTESFGQEGIKIHASKNNISPIIFYHKNYLEIFTFIFNKYNYAKTVENILDTLCSIIPNYDVKNTTLMNVLFGDISGESGFTPLIEERDDNIMKVYAEYMDFIIDF
jgi:hypothetical protein